jgi:hypothetical protein
MQEDDDLALAGLESPPVIVGEPDRPVQDGAGGDGADGHDHLRAERVQLRREERLTSAGLAGEGAAVPRPGPAGTARSGGPAFDGVGQVEEVLQVEPEAPDLAAQDHPPGAGPLAPVLDAGDSRSLADQHEPGITPAKGGRRKLPPASHRRARAARRDPPHRSRQRRRRPGRGGRRSAPQLPSQG